MLSGEYLTCLLKTHVQHNLSLHLTSLSRSFPLDPIRPRRGFQGQCHQTLQDGTPCRIRMRRSQKHTLTCGMCRNVSYTPPIFCPIGRSWTAAVRRCRDTFFAFVPYMQDLSCTFRITWHDVQTRSDTMVEGDSGTKPRRPSSVETS